ncbi:hypothetical protein ACWEQ0_20770 [Nocardia thailandica]
MSDQGNDAEWAAPGGTAYPPEVNWPQAGRATPGSAPGAIPPPPVASPVPGFPPDPAVAAAPGGWTPYPAAETPVPKPVTIAFWAMITGAVITVLGALIGVAQRDALRAETQGRLAGAFSDDFADTLFYVSFVGGLVMALISAGLWTWMAFTNRAGKNWARITASVFFGINALSFLVGVMSAAATQTSTAQAVSTAMGLLGFVAGLVAVVALWQKQCAPYFLPLPAAATYPYPPYPPYPPR